MDRDTAKENRRTAERLTKLETELDAITKERDAWKDLIRKAVIQTTLWLLGVGMAGIAFGWHLPENVRKAIAHWAAGDS